MNYKKKEEKEKKKKKDIVGTKVGNACTSNLKAVRTTRLSELYPERITLESGG